uniref:Uncharacterized protein n=1 Tax=Tanacetum cinerariifolium TaxID=118510 RepID=A0A6L2NWI0_TANCI|nr:hypothetical protein [Tanacetum cinerariifolium]
MHVFLLHHHCVRVRHLFGQKKITNEVWLCKNKETFVEASSHRSPTISFASPAMPLIFSLPPFVVGGVGGRLVM